MCLTALAAFGFSDFLSPRLRCAVSHWLVAFSGRQFIFTRQQLVDGFANASLISAVLIILATQRIPAFTRRLRSSQAFWLRSDLALKRTGADSPGTRAASFANAPAPLGRLESLSMFPSTPLQLCEYISVDELRLDAVKVASDRQPSALDFGAVRGDQLADGLQRSLAVGCRQ